MLLLQFCDICLLHYYYSESSFNAFLLFSAIPDLIRDPAFYLDSCIRKNDGKKLALYEIPSGCFAVVRISV